MRQKVVMTTVVDYKAHPHTLFIVREINLRACSLLNLIEIMQHTSGNEAASCWQLGKMK